MKPIDTNDLKQLRQNNDQLLLVNTLDPDHFDQTRIPGSINIPQSQDDFAAKVQQQATDRSQPVVVYCASEDCPSSTHAAEKLDRAGFSNVMDYEAGAKGWSKAGESLAS